MHKEVINSQLKELSGNDKVIVNGNNNVLLLVYVCMVVNLTL